MNNHQFPLTKILKPSGKITGFTNIIPKIWKSKKTDRNHSNIENNCLCNKLVIAASDNLAFKIMTEPNSNAKIQQLCNTNTMDHKTLCRVFETPAFL